MNWDYWAKRANQQRGNEKIGTPLERSGLRVIDWGNGIYINKSSFIPNKIRSNGETVNTKMMRFLNKTGLVEDVEFEMVN